MANHPENGDLPKYPTTNVEEYLAKLALDNGADLDTNIPGSHPQNGDLPEYPTTNIEEYLAWFTMNGLGKPTLGYFYEGKFYKDPEHTEEIAPKEGNLYFDVNSGIMYIYANNEFSPVGSKLYDTTGANTDGAMTQKATTDEVDRLDTRIDNIELSSDVVDVVATKADLDAYPTAGLKDKDIIKVLADETKEQATSYYRWNKAGNAWVFMASVGPYYTKTETDTLLESKADLGVSYTKTEEDELLDNKANIGDSYTKEEEDELLDGKEDVHNAYFEMAKVQDYLYDTSYSDLDYDYAKEYFETHEVEPVAGCSALRRGNFVGRNFDWMDDYKAAFVVRTPHAQGHYATVGVAGLVNELTEQVADSRVYSEGYKILPFYLQDGVNEKGLVAEINIAPSVAGNKSVPTVEKRDSICAIMIVRYVLDHFATADEAIDYLTKYVEIYMPKFLAEQHYDIHGMLADENKTIVFEIVNGQIKTFENEVITNFHLNGVNFLAGNKVYTNADATTGHLPSSIGVEPLGSGLERWNILADKNPETMEEMVSAMASVNYTQAYTLETDKWFSEFVGGDITTDTPSTNPALIARVAEYKHKYETRTKDNPETWITAHSSVYDIASRTLCVKAQEQIQQTVFGISQDYVAGENISINGNIISATDTTYGNFVGATAGSAGAAGLVPAPTTADASKFLKGDGTWAEAGGGGGAAAWGNIGGNIEDQTDLQETLGNKQNELFVIGHVLYIDPLDPSSIAVSPTAIELRKGKTQQLTVTVLPEEASDKRYILESSDSSIVTVDENGLMTCVEVGNATVTATTVAGGLTAACAVTVTPFITYGSVTYYDPADLQVVFDEEYKDGMEIVDQNKFMAAAKVAMGGVPFNTMSQWGEYMRLNVNYDSYMGGLQMYFEGGSSYGEWSGAPEDAGISINEGSDWAYGSWYLSDIVKGQRKTTELSSQAELTQLVASLTDSGWGDYVVDMDYQITIGSDKFAYGYITNFDFGIMPEDYTYPDNFLCTDRLESVTHEGNIINVGNNFLAQLRTNAEYWGSSWNCNCSFTNIVNIGDNFMAGRSGEFPDVFNATRIGNNFCGRGNMMEGGSFYGTFSGIFRNLTSLGTGFMEGYYPQNYSYIDLSFPVLETIPAGFMMYMEDYSGALGGLYVSLGGVKTITSPFMMYVNRIDYLEIGPNWSAYEVSSSYGDQGVCGSWNHIYINELVVHSTTVPSLPSSLDEGYCWTLDGTISGEGADAFMSVYPNGEFRNLWKNEY